MASYLEIRRIRAFIVTIALATVAVWASAIPASEAPNEYEVKAVMLFNLTHFVDWPVNAFPDTNSPIVIGILGNDPFGHSLETAIQGETVNGRRIVIRTFTRSQTLSPCHILFICANEKSKIDQILSKLKGRPVLTVSEIENFSKMPGGMVLIHTNSQKKIRLRLNLGTARSAGLNISSKLIQVAEPETTLWLRHRGWRKAEIAFSADTCGDSGAGQIQ